MQSLWMLLACAMFALMGAFIKVAADYGASLPQIVLFRGIPSVALLVLWAVSTGRTLCPSSWQRHLWRNITGIAALWAGFYALSHLPLPVAVSLNYTSPLFITGWMIASGALRRDWMRVLAVALGFFGVIAILRPSVGEAQFFAGLMGLCSGALGATAMLQVKQLGQLGEPEWRTVLIFSGCMCLTGLVVLALQGWSPLVWQAWGGLIALGISGLIAQLAMTRAFGFGSTILTAALQYTTIIFAALIGFVFWGDRPDVIAWIGMALVIGAGLLSTWRTYVTAQQKIKSQNANTETA